MQHNKVQSADSRSNSMAEYLNNNRRTGKDRRGGAPDTASQFFGQDRRSGDRRTYTPQDVRTISWGILRAVDVIAVAIVGVMAYFSRHNNFDLPQIYIVAIAFTSLLTFNYMQMVGAYKDILGSFGSFFWKVSKGWVWVVATIIVVAFLTKTSSNFSRIWVTTWLTSSFTILVFARIALWYQIQRWRRSGILTSNLVILGTRDHCEDFVRRVRVENDESFHCLGILLADKEDEIDAGELTNIDGIPVLGKLDQLENFMFRTPVQQVLIALPWGDIKLPFLIDRLKAFNCEVALSPGNVGFIMPDLGAYRLKGSTLIRVIERPISGWGNLVKGLEDRILGTFFLLLSLPILALVVIAIKLESRGPVIFQQKRLGFQNDEFVIYKFRSMRIDDAPDEKVTQATKQDSRITKVGKFLRRSSLDELPQLLNVVKGEMSLVGPRPHAVVHNMQYADMIDQYLGRHKVKPGITGWAQVNGLRGETDTVDKMQMRVQFDLDYIDNWSFLNDMKIILMTVTTIIGGKNAY